MSSAKNIANEFQWVVGDGNSISIMNDPWLSSLPLSRDANPYDVLSLAKDDKVSNLIKEDRTWNGDLINHLFPEEMASRVFDIVIPATSQPDVLCWGPHHLISVSAKHCLPFFFELTQSNQWQGGWIWKLKLQPRVKIFLWKAVNGWLPTKQFFATRGISLDPHCDLCPDSIEDMMHVLFHCPFAHSVWETSGLMEGINLSLQQMGEWLGIPISRLSPMERRNPM